MQETELIPVAYTSGQDQRIRTTYTTFENLEGLCETELCDEVHCLLAEGIRDNLQRSLTLHEREELRRLRCVRRPLDLWTAVGVKRVDEANEEVRHISTTKDVWELRRVCLHDVSRSRTGVSQRTRRFTE